MNNKSGHDNVWPLCLREMGESKAMPMNDEGPPRRPRPPRLPRRRRRRHFRWSTITLSVLFLVLRRPSDLCGDAFSSSHLILLHLEPSRPSIFSNRRGPARSLAEGASSTPLTRQKDFSATNERDDCFNKRTRLLQSARLISRWLGSFMMGLMIVSSTIDMPFQFALVSTSSSSSSSSVCWALTPEQLLVDDVWREVTRQFVDPTFHGMGEDGWRKQRLEALQKVAELGPPEDNSNNNNDPNEPVYDVIRTMLGSLGDPYTRFLTPQQYSTLTNAFTTPSSSTMTPSYGIGVQLIGDNRHQSSMGIDAGSGCTAGGVVVANTIANSPAAKGGVLPGDVIRSIDGVDVTGATAELVAAQCRGAVGTRVVLQIERPPAEGTAKGSSNQASPSKTMTLTLTRSPIATSISVETSLVALPDDQRLGVLRIASFTQETLGQISTALKDLLETQKASTLVIDVRGNAGGYMPAGVDVAKLFLPPRARIISEVDRTGRATIYINDGVGSETTLPLYILVDQRTASASEILTAALQDNGRGTVVGGTTTVHTFGKGRIQNVQPIQSGAGVAITKAKYLSPSGRDIQGIGITPDLISKTCAIQDSAFTCLEGVL